MAPRFLTLAATGLGAAAALAGVSPLLPAAVQPVPDVLAAAPCDDGAWTGAYNPEGAPPGFDAGDAGGLYVWHDAGAWHVRATDVLATDHHYAGTFALGGHARLLNVQPVMLESNDHVWIDGDDVLHYDFNTHAGIDGFDFHVSCNNPGHDQERLWVRTWYDGQPVAGRVRIGEGEVHPASASFEFDRSI